MKQNWDLTWSPQSYERFDYVFYLRLRASMFAEVNLLECKKGFLINFPHTREKKRKDLTYFQRVIIMDSSMI